MEEAELLKERLQAITVTLHGFVYLKNLHYTLIVFINIFN